VSSGPAVSSGPSGGGLGPVLSREWYARDVHEVARDLLGAFLTARSPEGDVTVRITEVEAYAGPADPGSHAYRGRTVRNAVMFDEPGHLYVYRHLGLHHCMNVVTGPSGVASAVLLRAGEVLDGQDLAWRRRTRRGVVGTARDLARGPARLTVCLGIDLSAYGVDLADPDGAIVLHASSSGPVEPRTGPRVGVSGAGGEAERFPWRYWLPDEPTVSAYRPAYRRPASVTVP